MEIPEDVALQLKDVNINRFMENRDQTVATIEAYLTDSNASVEFLEQQLIDVGMKLLDKSSILESFEEFSGGLREEMVVH